VSRLQFAIQGVTTGYLLLAVTAIYALGSIPMALHYLSGERFGLWALLGSLIGYLSMIDLGMSNSIGRHLIDVKDDRVGGTYGSAIKTGWVVLLAQGAILVLIGFWCADTFGRWMEIPTNLHRTFQVMIWLQCGVVAVGFVTKMFSYLLLAHQRMDVANYGGILSLLVNFLTLWIFFALGYDVYSLVFAGLIGTLAGAVYQWVWCCRLSLFPEKIGWGRVCGVMFKEMFHYGRDVFLVALGSQLIMASQTIIITRQLGLEAAAAWTVGTRTFTLVGQAVWRVSYTSLPALSEMFVRNERDRLRDRYPSLVRLVNSLSVYSAVAFVLCNTAFVSVWTSAKVSWSPIYDLLLGIWLIVLTWGNTNGGFVLASKKIHFMKYVYFLEGAVFVSASLLLAKPFGLAGMIVCSIVCSTCFSGIYTARRVGGLLGFSVREVALRWSQNAGLVLVTFGLVAVIGWGAIQTLNMQLRLLTGVSISLLVGLPLFLRLGVPDLLKREFISRTPKCFLPLLEAALGCTRASV